MTPACSSISLFPSAQTKNTRDGPTAAFPKDSILSRMGKPRIQPTISFVISFIPAWAGKTRSIDSRQDSKRGSSPLTRGKRLRTPLPRPCLRLIPAHAGKTASGPRCSWGRPAHPRSRGENGVADSCLTAFPGSSPLTRGKQGRAGVGVVAARLIPAHAGKTKLSAYCFSFSPAHPRSRGENASRGVQPRVHEAHPRSRGENTTCPLAKYLAIGSSPLTRGKHVTGLTRATPGRLIPAHAGKTAGDVLPVSRISAHPRSRGENSPPNLLMGEEAGSSPLTRGKPQQAALAVHTLRLIPAHAGKTIPDEIVFRDRLAHPRSRGENGC